MSEAKHGFSVRIFIPDGEPESLYLSELRRTLAKKGVLQDIGDSYRLAHDYTFASSSTAAGVILERSANGRIEWADGKGRTLKAIQESVTF